MTRATKQLTLATIAVTMAVLAMTSATITITTLATLTSRPARPAPSYASEPRALALAPTARLVAYPADGDTTGRGVALTYQSGLWCVP